MMERFSVAITKQIEVEAPAVKAWDRLHEVDNLHNVFSTVHLAESVGSPRVVGSKVKVNRLLPTGHCFLATYTIVRNDEENMEIQFYSEDIVSQGTATVSTTWVVEPIDENRCLVTISFAIVPHKMLIAAGRLFFAPFLKKVVKRTIKQDLKDLAASFEQEKELKMALSQHTKEGCRPTKSLVHVNKFEEGREKENTEHTRTTAVSIDDTASSISGFSYASRVTPLGRLGHPQEQSTPNIREVQCDGTISV